MRRRRAFGAPTFPSSIAQVQPTLRWAPLAPSYAAAASTGLVTVAGRGAAPQLEQLWSRLADGVEGALRDEVLPVAERAYREWPVATGYSRSRLRLLAFTSPTGISVRLENDAPYAATIRGGRTQATLIDEPLQRARRRIRTAIVREVTR